MYAYVYLYIYAYTIKICACKSVFNRGVLPCFNSLIENRFTSTYVYGICIYIEIYICIHAHLYICVYVYVHIFVCVCILCIWGSGRSVDLCVTNGMRLCV